MNMLDKTSLDHVESTRWLSQSKDHHTNAPHQTVNLLVESSNLSFPAIFNKSPSYIVSGRTSPRTSVPLENANLKKHYSPTGHRPYVMGCDPGVGGAVCVLDIENQKLVNVFDFPTEKNSKNRLRIDLLATAFMIDAYASQTMAALIEEVGQVGTNADPFSSFVFGFATGSVHGIMATCHIPLLLVKPNVWKMELGLTSNKDESIARAKKLFPDDAPKYLTLKKHHGRAEAILLAWYAFKHLRVIQ